MRRPIIVAAVTAALVAGGVAAVSAATNTVTANCTQHPTVTQTTLTGNPTGASAIRVTCTVPNPPAKTVTATATVTVTAQPSNSPTPTPTPTPTDTPTPTPTDPPTSTPPASGFSCSEGMGPACGPYGYDGIPMSNGYNTYVVAQPVNPHGTETIDANNPGDWQTTINLSDCGGCVQTYAHVQQLTNDWNGSGWGGTNGNQDTPLDSLPSLKIHYDETSPATGASYEFAPDIWQDNYGSDVMFWVDTKGRCNEGSFGSTLLGHATIDGQPWTVHRYGNAGDEIIFVLDGPGGPGTCAQQSSGTVNVKAGLQWLVDNGFESGPIVLANVSTGWEMAGGAGTFTVNDYSITTN